jgi:hypothetical protein
MRLFVVRSWTGRFNKSPYFPPPNTSGPR